MVFTSHREAPVPPPAEDLMNPAKRSRKMIGKRTGPCNNCNRAESAQWRVGPVHAPVLCNAWCVPA